MRAAAEIAEDVVEGDAAPEQAPSYQIWVGLQLTEDQLPRDCGTQPSR